MDRNLSEAAKTCVVAAEIVRVSHLFAKCLHILNV